MQIRQQPYVIAATVLVLAAALVAVLVLVDDGDGADASTSAAPEAIPQPSEAQLAAAGLDKLPVAPESERLDLVAPTFSNPHVVRTRITSAPSVSITAMVRRCPNYLANPFPVVR